MVCKNENLCKHENIRSVQESNKHTPGSQALWPRPNAGKCVLTAGPDFKNFYPLSFYFLIVQISVTEKNCNQKSYAFFPKKRPLKHLTNVPQNLECRL